MWIRLHKELRGLAVPWAQSVVAMLVLLLFVMLGYSWLTVFTGGFWMLCCFLSSRLFGSELDDRTLSVLLSQPIPRSRLWWEKMLAGAISIAAAQALLVAALWWSVKWFVDPKPAAVLGEWSWCLAPLVALATGPTVSLWLRDSLRTFWATLILPAGAYLVVMMGWTLASGGSGTPLAVEHVLAPFTVVMLILGYRRFATFELVAVQTAPSQPRKTSGSLLPKAVGGNGVVRTLVSKELWLHRSSLILIPLAVVGWIVCWLFSLRPDMRLVTGDLVRDWLQVLGFLPSAMLLMVVPVMLGCGAIASERQLGILPWQLALPVSRRLQWRVKLGVGLLLTVLTGSLGVVLAYAMAAQLESLAIPNALTLAPLLAFAAGFYSSRLGRGPFQALGLSLMFAVAAWLLVSLLKFTSLMLSTVQLGRLGHPLDLFGVRQGGLIEMGLVMLLVALVWRLPRQEDWLRSRPVIRSRGVAVLALLTLASFAAQALALGHNSRQLEKEIAAKDAEITHLLPSSGRHWIAGRLGVTTDQVEARHLSHFSHFGSYLSMVAQFESTADLQGETMLGGVTRKLFSNTPQPFTQAMGIVASIDGARYRSGTFQQWTSNRYAVRGSTSRHGWVEAYPRREPFSAPMLFLRGHPFSIARWWFHDSRLRQLERRVEQSVTLEAMRLGQCLELLGSLDPERARGLERRRERLLARPTPKITPVLVARGP